MKVRQHTMVKPHQVKNRRMQVPQVMAILYRCLTQLIRRTIRRPSLDSSTGHPVGKTLWIMITTARLTAGVKRLTHRHPAELPTPNHQSLI